MNSDLTRFNNQLVQLLQFLKTIECLERKKGVSLFEMKLEGIKLADSKKPLECFLKYVYPYKEAIMKRDESFFVQDFEGKVAKFSQDAKAQNDELLQDAGDDEFILHQALNIKQFWESEIDDNQKKIIWTYFQVLVKLTERYVAAKMNLV